MSIDINDLEQEALGTLQDICKRGTLEGRTNAAKEILYFVQQRRWEEADRANVKASLEAKESEPA